FHHQPGPSGGRGLPDADSVLPGHAQSDRGHHLHRARSAGSAGAARMSAPAVTTAAAAPARAQTPLRQFFADFGASKLALLGVALLVLTVGAALFAPWIAPQNPYDIASLDILDSKLPPGSESGD